MVQIEITKQPLYGSVYWDGKDFIYTQIQGFSGNDVYYYNRNDDGVLTSHRNYVNPLNYAPITLNPSVTADAYAITVIDINQLMVDSTNPFRNLTIVEIENPKNGSIINTGSKLYYDPNTKNTVENLNYVISDQQFFTTGILTLSVTNAKPEKPILVDTFKYRLLRAYLASLNIPNLSSNWDSSYKTLSSYKDIWNTIDTTKYVEFSNYIEDKSDILIFFYNYAPSYYGTLYSILTANSATWITDRSGIDFVKNSEKDLKNTYSILTSKSDRWNSDVNTYQSLSESLKDYTQKFESLRETISNPVNITNWDSNEIYDILDGNKNLWDAAFTILSTNDKNTQWNNTASITDVFSDNFTNDSNNLISLYNTVTSLSPTWSDLETENVLVSSDNWASVYSNKDNYDSLYNILCANSGLWVKDKNSSNNQFSLLTSNSGDWNGTLNVLTGSNTDNWNNMNSLNDVLSSSIINYNSTYNTVTANSGKWDTTNLTNFLTSISQDWINTYNLITKENDVFNITKNVSGYYNNNIDILNQTKNLVSLSANLWNDIINTYNTIILSANSLNDIYNNKGNYDNLYNILCSNSGTWIKDKIYSSNTNLLLSTISANLNDLNSIIVGPDVNNWDRYSQYNDVLSSSIINYNSTYNTITANSDKWDTTNLTNFLTSKSQDWINTYNLIFSLSDNLNDVFNITKNVSGYYNNNIDILNQTKNLVSLSANLWNDIINTYNTIILSANSLNDIYNNKGNYDNLYNILCSNSGTWFNKVNLLTSISSIIYNSYSKWNANNQSIIDGDWVNSSYYYNKLDDAVSKNNILFNDLFTTIQENSGKWASKSFFDILTAVSYWDNTYNYTITANKANVWTNNTNNLTSISSIFYKNGDLLNDLNYGIQENLNTWNNKTGSTVLTGNSANWNNSYNTVCSYSGGWSFNELDTYKSIYTYVNQNSSKLNDVLNVVNDKKDSWINYGLDLSALSSQFLTGSNGISFSANNLIVFNDTYIRGNLSALGGKIRVDTTLQTTSGFYINNSNNDSAVVIDKIGGGAILNLNTLSSSVLYVKANPKTVGINLSSIIDTINGVSNIALTVSGNISASGYVYPFPEYVTRFAGVSTAYETTYTYVTSTSSAINLFIVNDKPKYDSVVKYVIDGNIDTFSTITIPYYNNNLIAINTYSGRIPQINNYISLYGNVLDIDNLFSSNSSKYEESYDYSNTLNNSSKQIISHFFGHNIILQSQQVNVVVQDNIKIQSWGLYSDTSTSSLSVDLLSSTYGNFGKVGYPISITKGNPPYLTTSDKNSGANLDASWLGTTLPKGSILQFRLINTNNSPVSGLLINLTTIKQ